MPKPPKTEKERQFILLGGPDEWTPEDAAEWLKDQKWEVRGEPKAPAKKWQGWTFIAKPPLGQHMNNHSNMKWKIRGTQAARE